LPYIFDQRQQFSHGAAGTQLCTAFQSSLGVLLLHAEQLQFRTHQYQSTTHVAVATAKPLCGLQLRFF